jgi:hypothetical protein
LQGVVRPPPALNAPDTGPIDEMVTVLELTFLTVTVLAALVVPWSCAAKVRVAGVKESGVVPPPVPVPENGTICGEYSPPGVIATAPLIAPFAVGVNVTAILHLAFAARDDPHVVPLG